MKAFKIIDKKQLMSLLLTGEGFDMFLLEEAFITTFNQFHIDGRIQADFYTKEEQVEGTLCPFEFSLWRDMRGICFQLIKGRRTPLRFKTVLLLYPDQWRNLAGADFALPDVSGIKAFTLTVNYDSGTITLITGISTYSFLMDKTAENLWDEYLKQFLNNHQISWEFI